MKFSVAISAVLIGASVLVFAAKEQAKLDEHEMNPGKFYGIIVNNNANIILSQGERNSVNIEGDKQTTGMVKAHVQNGMLVIEGGIDPVNIRITAEEISLIEINGSGKIYGMGTIKTDLLLLKVNGSGSMKVDVRTLKVAMFVKGDGKIIVTGSTGESYSREYGNGRVYTSDLNAYSFTGDVNQEKGKL